jgi:hypothetical protein
MAMKIKSVAAHWMHIPIPPERPSLGITVRKDFLQKHAVKP